MTVCVPAWVTFPWAAAVLWVIPPDCFCTGLECVQDPLVTHSVDATTVEGRLATVVVVVAVVAVAERDSGDDARLGLSDWRGDTYGED